jgi:CheY-like chemotaxis protein
MRFQGEGGRADGDHQEAFHNLHYGGNGLPDATAKFLLADKPVSSKPRALVVDDDEPIRSLLSRVVAYQGFVVETARDGAEAIQRLGDDGYDVVLLDLMMPRVDGYSVLAWMRKEDPAMLKCTIVATAVPEREVARSLSDNVYRVHQKPFDLAQLVEDVRRCGEQ